LGREPTPQSVAKAPELSPAGGPTAAIGGGPGGTGAGVGASIEDAAALLVL
jgi:hypothetical protein